MSKLGNPHITIPRWMPVLYVLISISLIPWIEILSYKLPTRHVSNHWDVVWGGFDVGILIAVAMTAYFAFKKSGWVCLTSMSVFTLLVVDAWFDVLTARTRSQVRQAIWAALIVELPLAAVSLWLSYHVTQKLVKSTQHGK